jgi:hypothetical protein
MREVLILSVHLLVTVAKLLRPGGARAVAAESLLLKHQLLIRNRSRKRAPNLTTLDGTVNLPLGSMTKAMGGQLIVTGSSPEWRFVRASALIGIDRASTTPSQTHRGGNVKPAMAK